ncbi:MAG: hypothetical protein SOW43_08505 [Schaalia hyovaginalis]|uniref:hypothetical protein n=1 Tax=Schaalia hyovaginalis TaxID=29316 RepID=UPI0029FE63AE|nr:hypothetical protein [Schaalia hyovaginalis]MDD7554468.1 hypothetical protein [Schaalia hyovaginalis]MDY3094442.1 hypothetical protein [Schaalia hyovaginalis]
MRQGGSLLPHRRAPGSGKTILGLLLAVRDGRRALVLSSTSVIRDHWALVLHLLRSKIEEAGGDPLLIGLTATPPDPDDEGGAIPPALDERMRRAFDSDPFLALAAGRMLVRLDEDGTAIDPEIIRRLPDTEAPSLDDRLLLLARHALTRLLPDEGRAQEWRERKRLRIEFSAGSASEKALLHQCLAELFTPIGLSRPRHIIILGPMPEIKRSSPAHLPGASAVLPGSGHRPRERRDELAEPLSRDSLGPRHHEGGRAAIRIRVESRRGSGPGRGSADEGQFVDPRRRAGSEPRGHPDEGENRRALGVAAAHDSGRMAS